MLKVESIQNGIVIDHITAGKGMEIYRLLDLEASSPVRCTFTKCKKPEIRNKRPDQDRRYHSTVPAGYFRISG